MTIREEVKAAIIRRGGVNEVLNADLNEIADRTGCRYGKVTQALSYFCYSAQQKTFRESFRR